VAGPGRAPIRGERPGPAPDDGGGLGASASRGALAPARLSRRGGWAALTALLATLALALVAATPLAGVETIPNDPHFPNEWWLRNTGSNAPQPATPGADVAAAEAWGRTAATGLAPVVVGVVDQSINTSEPEFASRLLANPGEVPWNVIDDDGNGRVDDVYGYAFGYGVGIQPPNGASTGQYGDTDHGVVVSSLLAAGWNDGLGMAGASPNARLVIGLAPLGAPGDVSAAIRYAARRGARVINISLGTIHPRGSEVCAAITEVAPRTLVVVAAGNNAADNEQTRFWPADCDATGLSVAATDASDRLTAFTNWGAGAVDLAAPGQGMRLCPGCPANHGTSFAAPLVAAGAAVLFGARPEATPAQVRQALIEGAEGFGADPARPIAGGRLNMDGALVALDRLLAAPPGRPAGEPVLGPGSAAQPGTAATRARRIRVARRSPLSRRVMLMLDAPAGARAVSVKIGAGSLTNYRLRPRVALRLPPRPHRYRIRVRFIPGGAWVTRVALLLPPGASPRLRPQA
jgi:hypothetical protein